MTAKTFQTVRLTRGMHRSPDHGACVMELSSMIAGERFCDHPASVCRVIAAVLRPYNDLIGDGPRQDLYRYAAEVIGTGSNDTVAQARMSHCVRIIEAMAQERSHSLRWRMVSRAPKKFAPLQARVEAGEESLDLFGRCVARYFHGAGRRGHTRMLALVRELTAIGTPEPARLPVVRPAGRPTPAAAR